MKLTKTLFLFLTLHSIVGVAQTYIGYDTDNYSGIHSILSNPGNLSDSRVRADFNLFSLSAMGANDYVGLSSNNLNELLFKDGFSGLNTTSTNENNLLLNIEILGPSFMFSLNETNSLALTTRIRALNNYNNINGQLFESLSDGFDSENFNFELNQFDGTSHGWGEIGFSYGRVLYDDYNQNYLKAGVTLKYLLGYGVSQAYSQNLTGTFSSGTNQINLNGDFSYLLSYDDSQENYNILKDHSPGFGMDIGFVYEYRTRNSDRENGRNNPRSINNYRLKIGASLLDFGAITYKNLELENYSLNSNLDANEAEEDIIEAIENNFTSTNVLGDVTIALPTSLRINLDYKFTNSIYLNLDVNQTLIKKENYFNSNRLNLLSFTPRFESKKIGFYLPVSFSQLGKLGVGTGFKIGPLVAGSGSIISNFTSKKTQMANFYFGLKIPLNYN